MLSDMDGHLPISIWPELMQVGVELIDRSLWSWLICAPGFGCIMKCDLQFSLLAYAPNTGTSVWILKGPCSALPVGNCVMKWPADEYFKGNHGPAFACTAEVGVFESEWRLGNSSLHWMASEIHLCKYVYTGGFLVPEGHSVFPVPKIISKI